MNAEKELQLNARNPDFLCLSGSRLYGTNREDSDYDYRGFFLPPIEYIVGVRSCNDIDIDGADHKVYTLKRYLDLLYNGCPQSTELLFVEGDQVFRKNEIADKVLKNRDLFLSNNIYKRIAGFSYSEWRKAKGEKLVIEKRTKTEDDIISDIRNTFSLDKVDMDTVVEVLMSTKEKKVVSSKANLGGKRKLEHEKYGYGVSSATHAIRLNYQLVELLSTGRITFPRPEKDLLKEIRSGKMDLVEVEKVYDDINNKAKKAYDNSVLPDKPNKNKIDDLYMEILAEVFDF